MEDETMKKCKYCGIEFEGAYDFCSDFCRDTYITNHRTGKLNNAENIIKSKENLLLQIMIPLQKLHRKECRKA